MLLPNDCQMPLKLSQTATIISIWAEPIGN